MFSWKRPTSKSLPAPRLGIVCTSSGLTLLELIIAFVVLQVALVTFAQLLTSGLNFSLEVRRIEMAQILAQAKMEELIRTVPNRAALTFSGSEAAASRLLNERPGTFSELAEAHSEDIEPFMWTAEVSPSPNNPELLILTLHVYVVKKRIKPEKETAPVDEFSISEDRERFTFVHTLDDGAVEVMSGKEKLRVLSAVAFQ